MFLVLFVFTRFVYLNILPIFNDEAIYLDWGIREITMPGNLYYSLYDGKQPLLMWLFGISENIFHNPLFSGRLISIIFGFFTFIGIYFVSKKICGKKIALLSCFIYTVIPLFLFFDRQALMESAIGCIGVWSFYFLVKSLRDKSYSLILGIVLGIGFFIKSNVLLFAFTCFFIFLIKIFFHKEKKKYITMIAFFFTGILIVDFLLFINPTYWSTAYLNYRYSFTLLELLRFPFFAWIHNFLGNIEISFFYLTPFVLVYSLIGAFILFREGEKIKKYFVVWIFISLLLETIFSRSTSVRYIVSFLPFFSILSSYAMSVVVYRNRLMGLLFFVCTIFIVSKLSIFQIINPVGYIQSMAKYTQYSQKEYIEGYTSGFGVSEATQYLQDISKTKNIIVATAINTGNPESAIRTYVRRNKKIQLIYIDRNMVKNDLNSVECLTSNASMYFVSRDQQLANLNKYFSEVKRFNNPYSKSSVGLYELTRNCVGKTENIELRN